MGKPYSNTINRSKVLTRNIEQLLTRIEELVEANKKLRQYKDTVQQRWDAEIRVAHKEIEKQVREEIKQSTKES